MTTATITRNSIGYKVMTWQSVEKLAAEIGVVAYKESNQYSRNGYGIRITPKNHGFGDQTQIIIEANEGYYGDNKYMSQRVGTLAKQNFMLKLELWALKNNVQYKVTDERYSFYFQIIEG